MLEVMNNSEKAKLAFKLGNSESNLALTKVIAISSNNKSLTELVTYNVSDF